MERITIIKEKLQALKELDKGFSIFGSNYHRYEFAPTLSEEEIQQIEKEHTITISPEYRALLKHLGNGGAGCGYGLGSLSLKNINPPYPGTKYLLRNWKDPKNIDCEMVDSDEISGYIKLFDYGCGMETCLIVKGQEKGELIFFDCDERFEKLEDQRLLDTYENWLDYNLSLLKRVEKKLYESPLQTVIDSEWEIDNFSIKDMIISLIGAKPMLDSRTGHQLDEYLKSQYAQWKNKHG